jgi:hypothetical protein
MSPWAIPLHLLIYPPSALVSNETDLSGGGNEKIATSGDTDLSKVQRASSIFGGDQQRWSATYHRKRSVYTHVHSEANLCQSLSVKSRASSAQSLKSHHRNVQYNDHNGRLDSVDHQFPFVTY